MLSPTEKREETEQRGEHRQNPKQCQGVEVRGGRPEAKGRCSRDGRHNEKKEVAFRCVSMEDAVH